MLLDKLALRVLRKLQPETAHSFTLRGLEQYAALPGVNHSPYISINPGLATDTANTGAATGAGGAGGTTDTGGAADISDTGVVTDTGGAANTADTTDTSNTANIEAEHKQAQAQTQIKPLELMGLKFLNRVGIAAGLDKDGICINGLVSLGPAFIELGGVTPEPQPGNEGERIMRLESHQGMINRLGFNNLGCEQLAQRLAKFRQAYAKKHGAETATILGVNIGKNANTPLENAADDYCRVLQAVHAHTDYATLNISSPNTLGLKKLQATDYLAPLLEKVMRTEDQLRQSNKNTCPCPLLVKISPDLEEGQIREMMDVINNSGIAGVIATNTAANHAWQKEMEGGLSGRPLAARAGEVLEIVRSELDPKLCLIACGGIDSKEEMDNRLRAGADLAQVYTGLIYKGGGLIKELAR